MYYALSSHSVLDQLMVINTVVLTTNCLRIDPAAISGVMCLEHFCLNLIFSQLISAKMSS